MSSWNALSVNRLRGGFDSTTLATWSSSSSVIVASAITPPP